MNSKLNISHWLPIGLVLVIAIVLRLPLLNGSFWLDEAAQALESVRPLSEQLSIRDDFQPPLLHLILHFAHYVSISEWWLRLVGAVIPGLVTIFYTYKIGRLLKSKTVGTIAAVLLATSSFHIFYSQELRQYSLPAMFALIAWFLLLSIGEKNSKLNWKQVLIFSIVSAAGLYSSYLYPFVFITQVIWVLSHQRSKLSGWLKSLIITSLLFLPWLPSFLDQLDAGTQLQSDLPGWGRVVSPTQLRAIPLVITKFIYGVLDVEMTPVYLITFALIIGLLFFTILKQRKVLVTMKDIKVYIWWLVIPILISWIVSFWVPVLQPKRVLFCLPAFYLLTASLAHSELVTLSLKNFAARFWRYPSTILLFLILIINLASTGAYWSDPRLQREDWRQLIQNLEKRYPTNSISFFSFPAPFAPWRWYNTEVIASDASGELLLSQESIRDFLKQANNYNFVITFDYLADLTDPDRMLNQQLIAYGYKEIEVIDYPVIGFVRIYSKPEAVISYR